MVELLYKLGPIKLLNEIRFWRLQRTYVHTKYFAASTLFLSESKTYLFDRIFNTTLTHWSYDLIVLKSEQKGNPVFLFE